MNQRYNVRPGKGQSMFGFFVGLVFVFIGFVMVLPTFGAFGIIWVLVTIGITVMHGINAFTQKGVATHRVDVTTEANTSTEAIKQSDDSFDEKLRKLHQLKQEGILTDEEYEEKKKQMLKEKW
ncbi:hypothetical protein HMI01_06510 [Halolactibacillus miurensis]|uniref:Short C-terminal domain-containing protein n=1 Tax=Halolactibacillus miurensis TaxID=306541 RepID=A0A1I6R1F0_9BACI|nr:MULTISPECIES: SHOCT domain-containing protein [Halolactibacillus]GEM03663.1 hypothetical protein HMI01_06510 [Halolactibacillus miurensis]SFS58536.1 Short C-terminal domain-containing protein [Halolactibacillus miurensis]